MKQNDFSVKQQLSLSISISHNVQWAHFFRLFMNVFNDIFQQRQHIAQIDINWNRIHWTVHLIEKSKDCYTSFVFQRFRKRWVHFFHVNNMQLWRTTKGVISANWTKNVCPCRKWWFWSRMQNAMEVTAHCSTSLTNSAEHPYGNTQNSLTMLKCIDCFPACLHCNCFGRFLDTGWPMQRTFYHYASTRLTQLSI